MKDIELQKLGKYMRENDLKEDDVLELTKKSVEINPNNQRSVWKAMRLQLYITQRLEEHNKGLLGKKADSVRRVMEKDNYKRLVKTFQLSGRAGRAFKNFNHLITDPRQQHFFKLKNFKVKGLTKDFPIVLKKIGSWMGSLKRYFSEIKKDMTDMENAVEDEISIKENYSNQTKDKQKDE